MPRPMIVASGNLAQKDRVPGFMAKAQKLCLRSIVKVIEDGDFPSWDQLVMGG